MPRELGYLYQKVATAMTQYSIIPEGPEDDALLQEVLKRGHFKVSISESPKENSPEEQARIQQVLDRVFGSISPERADEINKEIHRMRDETWD